MITRFEIDEVLNNDLRLTSSIFRNNIDVDILVKSKKLTIKCTTTT